MAACKISLADEREDYHPRWGRRRRLRRRRFSDPLLHLLARERRIAFPRSCSYTPSNHQLAATGKSTAVAATEGWYSSPTSHRQDVAIVGQDSGGSTPKKTSSVSWKPAKVGAPTGKASPAKLRMDHTSQDNQTVICIAKPKGSILRE